LPIQDIDIQ